MLAGPLANAQHGPAPHLISESTALINVGIKLDRMAHDMANGFMRIDQSLLNLEKRMQTLENRMQNMEGRMAVLDGRHMHGHGHDARMDNIENRIAAYEPRIHNHEVRINNIEARGMDMAMDDVETSRLLAGAVM